LSSDDEEYLIPNNGTEMSPGQSNHAARWSIATRHYLNSLPEAPKNRGQINPNLNNYHSEPMEFSSKFGILDITNWWHQ
jgi:hypothetical protein